MKCVDSYLFVNLKVSTYLIFPVCWRRANIALTFKQSRMFAIVQITMGSIFNSPVILWFDLTVIATQMVSTVAATKISCSVRYQKSRKIP